jgi:MOSC domain-containing protein YiiM
VERLKVGTLILDNGKVGVITKVITSGTLKTDNDIINWRNNYEIFYDDGTISVIGENTLLKLIRREEIKII